MSVVVGQCCQCHCPPDIFVSCSCLWLLVNVINVIVHQTFLFRVLVFGCWLMLSMSLSTRHFFSCSCLWLLVNVINVIVLQTFLFRVLVFGCWLMLSMSLFSRHFCFVFLSLVVGQCYQCHCSPDIFVSCSCLWLLVNVINVIVLQTFLFRVLVCGCWSMLSMSLFSRHFCFVFLSVVVGQCYQCHCPPDIFVQYSYQWLLV